MKVDRVACPWLIQKFIDREAEFVFLPPNTYWSKISDGIVYDVPNCELGHYGEDVSFDSILKKYSLSDASKAYVIQRDGDAAADVVADDAAGEGPGRHRILRRVPHRDGVGGEALSC